MGAYRFQLPPGWVASPLTPSDSGLLVVPQDQGAAVLVLYAVSATDTLAAELEQLIAFSCRDHDILERGPVEEYTTRTQKGVMAWARVRERKPTSALEQKPREHAHLYALIEAGAERVPVMLLSAPQIAQSHRDGFRLVLSTLQPNPEPDAAQLSFWAD